VRRAWSLRAMVLGVAIVVVGVLLLFQPTSTSVEGTRFECGSAAAPDEAMVSVCSWDDRRFGSVATMSIGALTALVAGLWPALRGAPSRRDLDRTPH
jgi:hypothetical protein